MIGLKEQLDVSLTPTVRQALCRCFTVGIPPNSHDLPGMVVTNPILHTAQVSILKELQKENHLFPSVFNGAVSGPQATYGGCCVDS